MKTIISNNDGFKYVVEINKVEYPKGYTKLAFSTEWDHARRDGSEQKQFEIFLSEQQLANFKDLL